MTKGREQEEVRVNFVPVLKLYVPGLLVLVADLDGYCNGIRVSKRNSGWRCLLPMRGPCGE